MFNNVVNCLFSWSVLEVQMFVSKVRNLYSKIWSKCNEFKLESKVFVRSHGLQPTRLLSPWDSPGKNTGVGCHFLLQCMKVESESEVAQLCPTLCDPMDCSLPGSSIHGIFQARVLEWGAIAFSLFTTNFFVLAIGSVDFTDEVSNWYYWSVLQSAQ